MNKPLILNDTQNKYFVYRHIRVDKNIPFYIGIGTKKQWYTDYKTEYRRAFEKTNRTKYWRNIINKTDYTVDIILESDNYDLIKKKEVELINLHGRRDLGLGTLVNMTDGGEGNVNFKHSIESRNKMSITRKGCTKKGIIIYQYDENGKFIQEWKSIKAAEDFYNLTSGCINNCFIGVSQKSGGYFWSKVKFDVYISKKRIVLETPVYQYDLSGNFLRSWNNVKSISLFFNISKTAIFNCLNYKSHSCCNFLWDYSLKESKHITKKDRKFKNIVQLDLNNNIIQTYSSLRDLYESHFIDKNFKNFKQYILNVINGKRNTAFGYKWKYLKNNGIDGQAPNTSSNA